MYFCALGYGNLTCLANDPIVAPDREGPEGEAAVTEANVAVVPLLVGGLPAPFMVCVRAIEPGEEVLIDYGRPYWKAWRMLRLNTEAAARAASLP